MSTDKDYKEALQKIKTPEKLLNLLNAIKKDLIYKKRWNQGKMFETLVIRAFELEGSEVEYSYSIDYNDIFEKQSGNAVEQIDGYIKHDGMYCIVECKDSIHIDIEAIAKLRNQLMRRPSGVIGVLFSMDGFTAPAIFFSRFIFPQTILLWNGDELAVAIKKRGMLKGLELKYIHCVQKGIPDRNLTINW